MQIYVKGIALYCSVINLQKPVLAPPLMHTKVWPLQLNSLEKEKHFWGQPFLYFSPMEAFTTVAIYMFGRMSQHRAIYENCTLLKQFHPR